MRRQAMQQSGKHAGFTLLEVLVALVIIGTALGASLRAIGSLTQNSSGLRAASPLQLLQSASETRCRHF